MAVLWADVDGSPMGRGAEFVPLQASVFNRELRFTEYPNHARSRSAPTFDGED